MKMQIDIDTSELNDIILDGLRYRGMLKSDGQASVKVSVSKGYESTGYSGGRDPYISAILVTFS